MVAPQGTDVIPAVAEQADHVEHLLAARAAIDRVPEQEEAVAVSEGDNIFQQTSECQGAAVDIGNDESSWFHEILYST